MVSPGIDDESGLSSRAGYAHDQSHLLGLSPGTTSAVARRRELTGVWSLAESEGGAGAGDSF